MNTTPHRQHQIRLLPEDSEMQGAFARADASYDGIFLTAVRTTGIFCQPSCSARKPKPENVEFFATTSDALFAGYRPCKRCRPMEPPGQPPQWVRELLTAVQDEPERRWRDQDLRDRGIEPERARRWFARHHGMTFHAYARGLRLGSAMKAISTGKTRTEVAFDHGYDSLSGFGAALDKINESFADRKSVEAVLVRRIDTPLGPMIAGVVDQGLVLLEFSDRRALEAQLRTLSKRFSRPLMPGKHRFLDQIEAELSEYFDGTRRSFDVPLSLRGSDFQEAVWRELLTIGPGETRSYQQIANALNRPGAVRAVGTANGANRISILIPCHRVIGADGKLTGYGGGLWRKQFLLDLERR